MTHRSEQSLREILMAIVDEFESVVEHGGAVDDGAPLDEWAMAIRTAIDAMEKVGGTLDATVEL